MILKKSALLCFFILFVFMAFGQKANLSGVITDKSTNETLIGATIFLTETKQGTITDIDGKFQMEVEAGDYELVVNYLGYEDYKQKIALKAGEKLHLEIQIGESSTLLETATVTSGKFEKPLGEVTVSLSVLKPDLLESTSKTSVDKVLEKIPGVTIIDGQANIRGGSGYSQGAGSRVLLLLDDVPILTADAGFPNWDDIPIENIEQIEVVKGASSALYGSSALNGIINVRTAYAKSEPETKVAAFYTHNFAPQDTLQWWDKAPRSIATSFSHKRKMGKTDLILGGFYLNEESFNQETYKKYGRVNIGLRHRLTDRLVLGLNANLNTGKAGSFFYWASRENAYEPAATTATKRERLRYNIDPTLTYFDNKGNKHRFLGRYYHVNNDNDSNQSNKSDLGYGEYQFQRRFEELNLVATTGVVASGTKVDAELYGDTTFTSKNFAYYLQLDKKFGDRLNVSAGFRYEYNVLNNPGFEYAQGTVEPSEEKESHPVFRLGANYRIGKATFLRASWGQGYRFPTIAEKYIVTQAGGFFIVPNPDLNAETGWSSELGIKQGFRLGDFNGFFDLSVFTMVYQDMMEFNAGAQGFRSVNIGDTDIKGWETTIATQGKIGPVGLQILTGYTYIDPKFALFDTIPPMSFADATRAQLNALASSSKENILKYRSRHSFKLDLELEYKKFTLGLEAIHNSQLEAIDFFFLIIVPGLNDYRQDDENTKGYSVYSTRAAYKVTDGLRVSMIMGNMFNTIYSTRPGLLEAPRNLTVRVDYKF